MKLSGEVGDSKRISQERDTLPSAQSSRGFVARAAAISLEKVVLPQR